MVRFGVTSWVWVYPFNVSAIEKAKRAGADGIEIPVEDPKILDARSIKENLESHQLPCSSICAVMSPERDFTSPDRSIRDNALNYLKFCADFASKLEVDVIAGPVYAAVGKVIFDDKEKAWRMAVEGVREAARYARDRGVYIAVEPLNRYETSLVNLASDVLRFIEDVGEENVKAHFDTYHANIEEKSFSSAIRMLGDKLFHVHACENDRGTPGTGHIPWREVAEALKDIGYERWLVIETFQPGVKEIARAASIWRPLERSQDLLAENGLKFLRGLFK